MPLLQLKPAPEADAAFGAAAAAATGATLPAVLVVSELYTQEKQALPLVTLCPTILISDLLIPFPIITT